MNDQTLFSAHPVTWEKVHALYGKNVEIGGVRAWYHPERGWRDFPATSCMAMLPEHQIQSLAEQGATVVQLYVDVRDNETRTPDFRISELLQKPEII